MAAIERVRSGKASRIVFVRRQIDVVLILHLADELGVRVGELEVCGLYAAHGFLDSLYKFHLQTTVDRASGGKEHIDSTQGPVVSGNGVGAGKGAVTAGRTARCLQVGVKARGRVRGLRACLA